MLSFGMGKIAWNTISEERLSDLGISIGLVVIERFLCFPNKLHGGQ
jgi:hypothetical protein